MTNVETVLGSCCCTNQVGSAKAGAESGGCKPKCTAISPVSTKDDTEALTLLAVNLHRLSDFQRLNLVNREERSMIAQLSTGG